MEAAVAVASEAADSEEAMVEVAVVALEEAMEAAAGSAVDLVAASEAADSEEDMEAAL